MNAPGMFIVRHAPTHWNSPAGERLRGQKDVPVNADGREVATQRAAFFSENRIPIETVYTTNLQRDRVMAQAIAKATGAKIVVSPDIQPWHMGELQGESVKTGQPKLDRYMFKEPATVIPGGGESYNEFKARWIRFLQVHRHQSNQAVVTHLRNILTTAGAGEAGLVGNRVDLSKLRNYEPFKKIEIAYLSPQGEFVIMQTVQHEKEMVTS
jgi:broad specificity phosphatase PhoE